MRQVAIVLLVAGAGMFLVDFASTYMGKNAVFLGPGGTLAALQAKFPIPIDFTLAGVGGAIYVFGPK